MFYLILIFSILIFLFYKKYNDKKIKDEIFRRAEVDRREEAAERTRREEENNKNFNILNPKLDKIAEAIDVYNKFTNINNGYFSNYQANLWASKYADLYTSIKNIPTQNSLLTVDKIANINKLKEIYSDLKTKREAYNKEFYIKENMQYNSFFNNFNGISFDEQQRKAIIYDEDNTLVIAGAGSGKSTTIVGKVYYIIQRYNVKPSDILLISFTKKSAKDLNKKLNIEGLEIQTFHKYGKDVIRETEQLMPSVFESNELKRIIKKALNENITKKDYLERVTSFILDLSKPQKEIFEFETYDELIQYNKDNALKSYKTTNEKLTTYNLQIVKSYEELKIANFLFFNNIHYEYEQPYEHSVATYDYRQYKPDFTIIQNEKKIYIEHFGIRRDGSVPDFFEGDTKLTAKEKYHEEMKWKKRQHKIHETSLIETFSYQMREGILFNELTKNLIEAGIKIVPKTAQEKWDIINEVTKSEITELIDLISTFITLLKSNNYTINDVQIKIDRQNKNFEWERNNLFLEIIRPIFEYYQDNLRSRNEIDFSDMINKAADYIENKKFKKKYKYVIIDEFQDLSNGRYQLLKAIKKANVDCKFFCVGDDWQSIYRFTGSDIALFKNFEHYFGYTIKMNIENTYRFNNPLIALSSNFILKNQNQSKKDLKAVSASKKTNYKICISSNDNDDSLEVIKIFNELILNSKENVRKSTIILGRYSFDLDRIAINDQLIVYIAKFNKETGVYISKKLYAKNIKIEDDEKIIVVYKKIDNTIIQAEFLTVHKAKGLEADNVIILNCNTGKHGFPSQIADDSILNLLLSEADQYENGEERRLFYVAMTRAKENVYFIANENYKSKFIEEIEKTSHNNENKCSKCKIGNYNLIKEGIAVNGNKYKFYGCSNYIYGCDYIKKVWFNN